MAGNRIALPAQPLRHCASCGTARRNRTVGWSPIARASQVVGWTCPDCPRFDEPIRRTGSKFVAVIRDRQRRQVKRTLPTLAAARAWVASVPTGPAVVDDMTLAELAGKWLERRTVDRDNGRIRTGTLDSYKHALSPVLAILGDLPARSITRVDLEATLKQLADTGNPDGWDRALGHKSLIHTVGRTTQMFDWALACGLVASNPTAGVRPPTRPNPRPIDRWTPLELIKFREAVDADPQLWVRAGMRLTLCGLRRSEVLGLDWADIHDGRVDIRQSRTPTGTGAPKSSRSWRTVAAETIHPGTAGILRDLWVARNQPGRGLVISDGETPIRPARYTAAFRRVCRTAGVPVLTSIHNIRHTIATALKEAGVPDNQAAGLLGHDVATFQRFYLVTDEVAADQAAEAAGSLFTVVDAPRLS